MQNRYGEGLRDFPWRRNKDPYRILLSEFMLQQTQTARVLFYYENFLSSFPTIEALAESSFSQVLELWQGLGYNRRALFLHQSAIKIVKEFGSRVPQCEAELLTLPGIGKYTARAILVFAFEQPLTLIETNIRAVLLHEFFKERREVTEEEIEKVAELLLDRQAPRSWNYALMDYGVELKRQTPGIHKRWQGYCRQSRFEGSVRQVRGAILRLLIQGKRVQMPIDEIERTLGPKYPKDRIKKALQGLQADALVRLSKTRVASITSS